MAQTRQGQLDVSWLDLTSNPHRQAVFSETHNTTQLLPLDKPRHTLSNKANDYQSFGYLFPAENCFDFQLLNHLISQLKVEIIKGGG